ncbi:FMN-dependent NADPH-azoreductase [Folsomia candida]|uniref:FMN-dependent NADPH-azoreductase n=1 Tax=Folsomia candida TaxID=158441 RepID=UPI00160543B6|nr:FMN-dependent NADPH-azoreductase [Folsomia candida]
MSLNIVSILGSVRGGRMVERVGKVVHKCIQNRGVTPIVMDPLKLSKYELVQQPLHYIQNPDHVPAWMKSAHETVLKADAFFVVVSEYNSGVPPALTNLMNCFPPSSYRHKPVGIVTYSMGNFGGARTLTIVRPYLNELGLLPVPCYVPIPTVNTLIDEDGNTTNQMVLDRIGLAVKEVLWYGQGLKDLKLKTPPPI